MDSQVVQGLVLPDVGEIGKLDVVEVYFVLGLVLEATSVPLRYVEESVDSCEVLIAEAVQSSYRVHQSELEVCTSTVHQDPALHPSLPALRAPAAHSSVYSSLSPPVLESR